MSSQNEIKRKLLHLPGQHKYGLQLLWKNANCMLAEQVYLKFLKMPYMHSHNNSAPIIVLNVSHNVTRVCLGFKGFLCHHLAHF